MHQVVAALLEMEKIVPLVLGAPCRWSGSCCIPIAFFFFKPFMNRFAPVHVHTDAVSSADQPDITSSLPLNAFELKPVFFVWGFLILPHG